MWPLNKHTTYLAVFFLLIIAILSTVLLGSKVYRLTRGIKIDPNVYQAVFLENKQLYFGHLKNADSLSPTLYDVYYVQVDDTAPRAQRNRLVRLGETEPHGPQNEMILNGDHILFWENLRSDSPLVKTIQSLNVQRK